MSLDAVWQALVLGMLQGATEFVPVSSSAHLIIAPELAGWPPPSVAFDVLVHLATLIAVFAYFAGDWLAMLRGVVHRTRPASPRDAAARPKEVDEALTAASVAPPVVAASDAPAEASEIAATAAASAEVGPVAGEAHRWPGPDRSMDDRRLAGLLVIGTLPGVIGGLLLKDFLGMMLEQHPRWAAREAAIELMLSGLILIAAERWARRASRHLSGLGVKDALLIGTAQAVAILPGISRSGATIAAGRFLGLGRADAARFSFLLSAPIILGANVVKLDDLMRQPPTSAEAMSLAVGFGGALVVGYLALGWLMRFLSRSSLNRFAAYCLAAGAIALVMLR